MPLNELLPKAVRLYPAREAVVCGDIRLDYEGFSKRVWRLSNGLMHLGIKKGDCLAVLHENCHIFLELYFSAAHLGLILLPLNIRLAPEELSVILRDSGACILVAQAKFQDRVLAFIDDARKIQEIIWTQSGAGEQEPEGLNYEDIIAGESETPPVHIHIRDTDVAHLYYTSGTTGRPKGVMLTHKNVKAHSLGAIAELQLTDGDHWIHAAPLFHLADAWATFAVTWVGGKHVIIPFFEPSGIFKAIEQEKVTITNLIPTMLNMMVNHPEVGNYDYSSLRVLMSGGAPIAPELVRRIMEVFRCDYIQTYGMTETSPYLTLSILKKHLMSLPREERIGFKIKTGREFINVNLRIVDRQGKDVARDNREVGEIIVKGDTVTPGYWNLPEETQKAIKDGWLYTGDLAVMDREGYVTIVDRKKDMILTGGENVYSTEVENVLYRHQGILEAAVIGIPDNHWGEAVKACIVLKEGSSVTADEIISFCKQHLAHYKAPKSVEFLDALPKTGSGKISKKALRNSYRNG